MAEIHLLLVDDDPDDCFIFSQIKDKIPDITITCLHDSRNLFQVLSTSHPVDLIFLDLNMPIPNGLECLQKIKNDPEWKHLPVIVYTTASQHDIRQQCYKYGADDFITKPSSITKLVSAIKSVIDRFIPS